MSKKPVRKDMPAKRGGSRYDWDTITTELHEHPGEWMLVEEQVPRAIGSAVNTGRIMRLRDGVGGWNYAAATRNNNGNNADLWMCATPTTKPKPKRERKSRATANPS